MLAIKHDYAAAILAGTKTVELRSYLPRNLHPGDTIYLVGQGRIWGHCTFAGAVAAPPPGACRERWLESTDTPAPTETHPRLANYLLYLKTHKTP